MQFSYLLFAALLVLAANVCPQTMHNEDNNSETLEQRIARFQRSVCEKCSKRGIDCGCQHITSNDSQPFSLLHSYARQYQRWQAQVAEGHDGGKLRWVIVDVEGGAGNQLIHMVCVYVHERASERACERERLRTHTHRHTNDMIYSNYFT